MDIWQLSVFYEVIKLESFSKAAEAIHISQPTVSNHIKNLEDYFGCPLIDRVDKKALPTKAGLLLFEYARKLIKLKEEMETAIAGFQGLFKGNLTIGASTIPGGYILPKLIGEFRRLYNDITISMTIADSKEIMDNVLIGEAELGIIGTKCHHNKILQEKLIDDEMYLIVPVDHPWSSRNTIMIEELKNEPFIIREQGSGTLKSIQESLGKRALKYDQLNIVAELGNTTAVIQGIKNNLGVSILSPVSIRDDLNNNTLKALKIDGLSFKRCFYLIRHKNRTPSPLHEAFTSYLKSKEELI
ncbi:LysR family transcriptional regulator [bacterium]|nr:LysR family transcriptional regulator [bacterium]